jgi:hypothetical protein
LSGGDTEVAEITVPSGSYAIFGKAGIGNNDGDTQTANCKLSTGDVSRLALGQLGSGAYFADIIVHDDSTFTQPTTIRMTCATFNGAAAGIKLTAITVSAIN